jgi:acetyltransferase-like isoleucine patch superfamily enzyme
VTLPGANKGEKGDLPMDVRDVAVVNGAWDHRALPANIRVGEGCYLERRDSFSRFRSARDPGLVLGRGVRVYTWTAFSVEPDGVVEVGDDSLLVGALFMCAERIRLGARVVVSYNVTIADCDFHPRDPELRQRDAVANAPEGDLRQRPPLLARPVVIEDDVWIGIGAIILKGVHVGAGARIGAGAVVTASVPAGAYIAGNPAHAVAQDASGAPPVGAPAAPGEAGEVGP